MWALGTLVERLQRYYSRLERKKDTSGVYLSSFFLNGEPDGVRTHGPLIKSQMLYP